MDNGQLDAVAGAELFEAVDPVVLEESDDFSGLADFSEDFSPPVDSLLGPEALPALPPPDSRLSVR